MNSDFSMGLLSSYKSFQFILGKYNLNYLVISLQLLILENIYGKNYEAVM